MIQKLFFKFNTEHGFHTEAKSDHSFYHVIKIIILKQIARLKVL